MKAYNECPVCGERKNIDQLKETSKKTFCAVLCGKCNKLYYQTFQDLNTNTEDTDEVPDKTEDIKPDHDEPVPVYEPKYDPELLPAKPVKHTTSQARL